MINTRTIQLWLLILFIGCSTSDSGKKVVETTYSDGTPKLIRVFYEKTDEILESNFYINGVKERERILKNGYPNGSWKEWHKNGQLKFNKNYRNGEMDGAQKGWYRDGTLFFESFYENGKLVSRTIYNHDGTVKSTL